MSSDPNIVLLVVDTARVDGVDTGSGTERTTTPNVADIGAAGQVYEDARAPAPWTLPSHASMFTGTYPSKHGAHAGHKHLGDNLPTLAEALSAAGYETVGASNNTWVSDEFGFARGFERFFKSWQLVQSTTDSGAVARKTEGGTDRFRALFETMFDGNPVVNALNALYGQFGRKRKDDGAARTNQWIESWLDGRTADRPFFLFVNYLEPHLEYRPPRKFAERFLPDDVSYETAMSVPQDAWGYLAGTVDIDPSEFEILRALYRAELSYVDERIGELRSTLEAAGEWEDTLVVVTGDHGENIGDHGFMDHQYCLYETLLRVPLVVGGGAAWSGAPSNRSVTLVDLAPTLLDVAGVDGETDRWHREMQGVSFHPDADADPARPIFAEYRAPQPSMDALERRVGALPARVRQYDRSLRAVQEGRWKLIRGSDGSVELYDIEDDPDETTDRSDEEVAHVKTLTDRLDGWLAGFEFAETTEETTMDGATRRRLEDLGYLQ